MRSLYENVNRILDNIDFGAIWTGFSKFDFALYNHEFVYLKSQTIPYDERFLGNTSILYNNQYIAIWYVQNPNQEDAQILAADLVHEMFHAFQYVKGEQRFPDDLILLNQPENHNNQKMRHIENLLLVQAYESDDILSIKQYVKKFMAARKYREQVFGESVIQECYTETIEGMAEYVGCIALKQINKEKYSDKIENYIKVLKTIDARFFNVRQMLYFTGTTFCILLSKIGMDVCHAIDNTKTSFFHIESKGVVAEECSNIQFDHKELLYQTNQYHERKREKIKLFLQEHHQKVKEDFIICGYDPMNMIRLEEEILCSHFVMLKGEQSAEPFIINQPVLLQMKQGSANEVEAYTI